MTHLDNHPHAFIGEDGTVLTVAIFNEHDDALIADCVANFPLAIEAIDCCEHGAAAIGNYWDGEQFISPAIEEVAEDIVEPETPVDDTPPVIE